MPAEVAALEPAEDADLPAIVALMNRAYRANGADAGWTSEAGYIAGARTCAALLRDEMAANPAGTMLVWRRPSGLAGCVWLEPHGDGLYYLGSLTVDPKLQDAGRGRALLAAAEAEVRTRRGRAIEMSVVDIRDTLIAWYVRRGYAPTGETTPFPYHDTRFGTPLRDDLRFVVLRKDLE